MQDSKAMLNISHDRYIPIHCFLSGIALNIWKASSPTVDAIPFPDGLASLPFSLTAVSELKGCWERGIGKGDIIQFPNGSLSSDVPASIFSPLGIGGSILKGVV